MIRASLGNPEYWDKWTAFSEQTIAKDIEHIKLPSGNLVYRPQFIWDISLEHVRLLLSRYSRGDAIRDLSQYFPGLLEAWELSNQLALEICAEHGLKTCRDWDFSLTNLNHYTHCFGLVGLALALEIPEGPSGSACLP
ncbi:PoNe immunity protein domain-containing protein [Ralstonia solanacearum]|uniref:PoNe immunity protein domain-containing protein n=1 Tax=Ralstonia solanacearum TaxID=305 RepID=UPI003CC5C1E6